MSQQKRSDLSELIAEEFGANATYVQGLLERFRSNPDLVDDSWRAYFTELLGDGAGIQQTSGNGLRSATVSSSVETAAAPAPSRPPEVSKPQAKVVSPPAISEDAEVSAIRGPALKIVENMSVLVVIQIASIQLPRWRNFIGAFAASLTCRWRHELSVEEGEFLLAVF